MGAVKNGGGEIRNPNQDDLEGKPTQPVSQTLQECLQRVLPAATNQPEVEIKFNNFTADTTIDYSLLQQQYKKKKSHFKCQLLHLNNYIDSVRIFNTIFKPTFKLLAPYQYL